MVLPNCHSIVFITLHIIQSTLIGSRITLLTITYMNIVYEMVTKMDVASAENTDKVIQSTNDGLRNNVKLEALKMLSRTTFET